MDAILKTGLYRSLAEGHKDVELWQENFTEEGWSFFSVVRFTKGEATILAELRMKEGQIQNRARGADGAEAWVDTV